MYPLTISFCVGIWANERVLASLGAETRSASSLCEMDLTPGVSAVFFLCQLELKCRRETGPITYPCPDCPRWFDVYALPPDPEEDSDSLNAELSMQRIQTIIEDVIRDGILPHNVFVVGFSQGSAVALLSGLTCKHKLGGIGVLAGWLPPKLTEVSCILQNRFGSMMHQIGHRSCSKRTLLLVPRCSGLMV